MNSRNQNIKMLICILCCARGIKILENPLNGISSGSPLFADWWWTFWLSSPARQTQCNGARTSALTKSAGKSSPSSLRVELKGKLASPRLINDSFLISSLWPTQGVVGSKLHHHVGTDATPDITADQNRADSPSVFSVCCKQIKS